MTGWLVSRKCAVACCRGEESQQATLPQSRHCAQAPPSGCPRRGSAWQTPGRRRSRPRGTARGRRRPRPPGGGVGGDRAQLARAPGGDVEHRLLDVEHREHLADHLRGDRARCCGSPAPGAARRRSSRAGSGSRARSGVSWSAVVPSRSQAAKLRWSMRCSDQRRRRRAGRRTPARRAPRSPALDACCSSVARASASSIGSGDGHPQPAGHPAAARGPG